MNWRVGGYLVGWLVGWFNSQLVNLGASDCHGGRTRSPRGGGLGWMPRPVAGTAAARNKGRATANGKSANWRLARTLYVRNMLLRESVGWGHGRRGDAVTISPKNG